VPYLSWVLGRDTLPSCIVDPKCQRMPPGCVEPPPLGFKVYFKIDSQYPRRASAALRWA
jgi:hypothetical protein